MEGYGIPTGKFPEATASNFKLILHVGDLSKFKFRAKSNLAPMRNALYARECKVFETNASGLLN